MAGATRQHYSIASGGGLQSADNSSKVLKYAKGGKVSAYKQPSNWAGKPVGKADNPNTAKGSVKAGVSAGAFKKGMNVSGRKGDDKFTTITHKAKYVPKGFKVQMP